MPRAKKSRPEEPSKQHTNNNSKEKQDTTQNTPRMYRSVNNRILGGVAGGLGEYFQIDPTLVRIIFILLALFAGGFGILLYLILWFILPSENDTTTHPHTTMKNNMQDFRTSVQSMGQRLREENRSGSHLWLGGILVIIGLLVLSNNFGFFNGVSLDKLWPLLLIIGGILLLYRP